MENVRYKPKLDKLFWWILIPTSVFLVAMTVVCCFAPVSLFVMIPTELLTFYFLLTPLFGYVELREETVFIKFGLIMKREIPYGRIRGVEKVRRFYSDSMLSLKNSLDHLNVKYNTFDMVSVSVVDNDGLMEEIKRRKDMQKAT